MTTSNSPRFLAAMLLMSAATTTIADVTDYYSFSLRRQQSSVSTDLAAGATLAGTLIGDYDKVTNPTGTRTIPGIIGPTGGNTPIPFSGAAGFAGSDTTNPTGSFNLALDLDAGTASISGLDLDLLSGGELGVTLGLTIEYDSFRTRQPTALFLGGIAIPIPFGQVNVTTLTLVQTDLSGIGILQDAGDGRYTATFIAPVALTAAIETPGEPIAVGPITIPLPLVLEVELTGDTATAVFTFDQSFAQQIPLDFELPADQALDLPTILPPGETAHLLLNGAISSFDIEISQGAVLDAAGTRQTFSRADWNRDGTVNSVDYFLFVLEFMTTGADFNGDSATNSQDYFDFLVVYFDDR